LVVSLYTVVNGERTWNFECLTMLELIIAK
jgi:hypothetical protein